jgi:hypothetical protein
MPALVAGIHVFFMNILAQKGVDDRVKPGQDGSKV